MKQFIITLAGACIFFACNYGDKGQLTETTDSTSDVFINIQPSEIINYTLLENYFVKNDVSVSAFQRIETADQFQKMFGMATTMGDKGKPTEVDFNTHYVLAVINPETNLATQIKPLQLVKQADSSLVLTYVESVGDTQSYTQLPFFAIAVSKTVKGSIQIYRIKEISNP